MKKIFTLLLIVLSIFLLASCSNGEYPPVASTAEEKRVMMTVEYDGEKYDVKYELYRALFTALKSEVDGGDDSVWTGADKDKYIAKIDALIKEKAAEIYSVLHIAEKADIDIYSNKYDEKVSEIIKMSVDGGTYDDTEIEGFGGNYDKYLAHLAEDGINYSVQDLLIRYQLASEDVYLHYAGNIDSEEFLDNVVKGELEYTPDDVYDFYYSADCVRVIRAYLPKKYYTENRANEIHSEIVKKASKGEGELVNYIIGITSTAALDIKNGEVIAKHNLDNNYSELVNTAFNLSMFEVSDILNLDNGFEDAYVIIYKTVKLDSHLEECYNQILGVYLQNRVGEIIDTVSVSLNEGFKATDALASLNRADILNK